MARFLTQPSASPAEWAARAGRQFTEPGQASIQRFALAYALLLEKQFQPAALTLKEIHESGAPADDEGLQILLGWAYLETGRTREAGPLIRFNPIPSSSGPGPFSSFYFPRLYHLRGLEAERQGKPAEAHANYDLFRKISGPLPLVWDR